MIFVSVSDK